MNFKGFQKSSFNEYPGKIVCIAFTGGCNFRCPFCHNSELIFHTEKMDDISEDEIISYMEQRKKLIDGISITGGEPTLHKALPDFIRKVKQKGFVVELETNGTNPVMVEELVKDKLVDYFAMDIKAPLTEEKYFDVIGRVGNKEELLKNIKRSIRIIRDSGVNYEFRTTFVPGLLKKEDILTIADQLKGSKKYVIQGFLPNSTLDPEYEKKKASSPELLDELKRELKNHFGEIVTRI